MMGLPVGEQCDSQYKRVCCPHCITGAGAPSRACEDGSNCPSVLQSPGSCCGFLAWCEVGVPRRCRECWPSPPCFRGELASNNRDDCAVSCTPCPRSRPVSPWDIRRRRANGKLGCCSDSGADPLNTAQTASATTMEHMMHASSTSWVGMPVGLEPRVCRARARRDRAIPQQPAARQRAVCLASNPTQPVNKRGQNAHLACYVWGLWARARSSQ